MPLDVVFTRTSPGGIGVLALQPADGCAATAAAATVVVVLDARSPIEVVVGAAFAPDELLEHAARPNAQATSTTRRLRRMAHVGTSSRAGACGRPPTLRR